MLFRTLLLLILLLGIQGTIITDNNCICAVTLTASAMSAAPKAQVGCQSRPNFLDNSTSVFWCSVDAARSPACGTNVADYGLVDTCANAGFVNVDVAANSALIETGQDAWTFYTGQLISFSWTSQLLENNERVSFSVYTPTLKTITSNWNISQSPAVVKISDSGSPITLSGFSPVLFSTLRDTAINGGSTPKVMNSTQQILILQSKINYIEIRKNRSLILPTTFVPMDGEAMNVRFGGVGSANFGTVTVSIRQCGTSTNPTCTTTPNSANPVVGTAVYIQTFRGNMDVNYSLPRTASFTSGFNYQVAITVVSPQSIGTTLSNNQYTFGSTGFKFTHAPSSTPSSTRTPSPSPSPTGSPTPTPTVSPSGTPTPSESPSLTPTPSESPSQSPTPSLTVGASPSQTPSPTPSGTSSPTPSLTPTPSPTPSLTPTPSITGSSSISPSQSASATSTPSPSGSPSLSPTPSLSVGNSPSPSSAPTVFTLTLTILTSSSPLSVSPGTAGYAALTSILQAVLIALQGFPSTAVLKITSVIADPVAPYPALSLSITITCSSASLAQNIALSTAHGNSSITFAIVAALSSAPGSPLTVSSSGSTPSAYFTSMSLGTQDATALAIAAAERGATSTAMPSISSAASPTSSPTTSLSIGNSPSPSSAPTVFSLTLTIISSTSPLAISPGTAGYAALTSILQALLIALQGFPSTAIVTITGVIADPVAPYPALSLSITITCSSASLAQNIALSTARGDSSITFAIVAALSSVPGSPLTVSSSGSTPSAYFTSMSLGTQDATALAIAAAERGATSTAMPSISSAASPTSLPTSSLSIYASPLPSSAPTVFSLTLTILTSSAPLSVSPGTAGYAALTSILQALLIALQGFPSTAIVTITGVIEDRSLSLPALSLSITITCSSASLAQNIALSTARGDSSITFAIVAALSSAPGSPLTVSSSGSTPSAYFTSMSLGTQDAAALAIAAAERGATSTAMPSISSAASPTSSPTTSLSIGNSPSPSSAPTVFSLSFTIVTSTTNLTITPCTGPCAALTSILQAVLIAMQGFPSTAVLKITSVIADPVAPYPALSLSITITCSSASLAQNIALSTARGNSSITSAIVAALSSAPGSPLTVSSSGSTPSAYFTSMSLGTQDAAALAIAAAERGATSTAKPSSSSAASVSPSSSNTVTPSPTATQTATPTPTVSPTGTPTPSQTPSQTPTPTLSIGASPSSTVSVTATVTPTMTITPSSSLSQSSSITPSLTMGASPSTSFSSTPSLTSTPLPFEQKDAYIKFLVLVLPASNKTTASEFFKPIEFSASAITSPLRRDLSKLVEVGMSRIVVTSITDMSTNLSQTMPTDKQIDQIVSRRRQLQAAARGGSDSNVSRPLETGISVEVGIGLGKSPEAKAVTLLINKTVNILANAVENDTVPFLSSFSEALSTKSTSKLAPEVFMLSVDLTSLGYVPAKKGPPPPDMLAIIAGSSSAGAFLLMVACYYGIRAFFVAKEKKEQVERELRLYKPRLVDNPLNQRRLKMGRERRGLEKKKNFIPLPIEAPELLSLRTQQQVDDEVSSLSVREIQKREQAIRDIQSSSAQLGRSLGELSDSLYDDINDDEDGEDLRLEVQSMQQQILQTEARLKQRQER